MSAWCSEAVGAESGGLCPADTKSEMKGSRGLIGRERVARAIFKGFTPAVHSNGPQTQHLQSERSKYNFTCKSGHRIQRNAFLGKVLNGSLHGGVRRGFGKWVAFRSKDQPWFSL